MATQTRIPVLDLAPQLASLWEELNRAIQRTLRSSHYILGPEVHAFEQEAARYLGVRHAIGCNSGTDALVIALRALGIGPGDEVITTPFTFFATAEAISQVGATPVFVDVEEESMNLDPSLVERAITPRTRAILPVHLFGRPCDMEAILELARRHGLMVVEDCAQSFGARCQGRQTGSLGQMGCFSFFPSKNLGAYGDGGLLATQDDQLADLARALRALGIGPGDEVITSPFTFFATAEAISQVGAVPVFADVEEESMNLDPALAARAVTPRTRAILPVHLFGRPCDMAGILDLARRRGLLVVEDCAQSFGARHRGRHTGTLGQAGCFSFFPSKNLGAFGDGGMLATDDDQVADLARALRVHGSRKKYHNEMVGYNSRLDELQAAILRVKLPHVDAWNTGRRRVAENYRQLLEGHPGIITPRVVEGHVFHQYTVRVPGCDRDRLQARLAEDGVDTMVYYPVPCHRLKFYEQSHAHVACPRAERLCAEVISLPIWPEMDEAAQDAVAQALLAQVGRG